MVDFHDKDYEWCRKKVFKEDFVSVKVYYKVDYADLKSIKMKDLIEDLSAEEFILFLKDNEINYLPKLY